MSQLRRVTVSEELDARVVIKHIQGGIYTLEQTGHSYFTKTMILNYVNNKLGWPRKNDPEALNLFKHLLKEVLVDYQPNLQVRGGYSFMLKPDSTTIFSAKLLKAR